MTLPDATALLIGLGTVAVGIGGLLIGAASVSRGATAGGVPLGFDGWLWPGWALWAGGWALVWIGARQGPQ